jgi:hypothetical protein
MAKKSCPDDTERENELREGARDGFQGLRGLSRALDIGLALRMESCGGRNDDGERYHIGECHADHRVQANSPEFMRCVGRIALQRLLLGRQVGPLRIDRQACIQINAHSWICRMDMATEGAGQKPDPWARPWGLSVKTIKFAKLVALRRTAAPARSRTEAEWPSRRN